MPFYTEKLNSDPDGMEKSGHKAGWKWCGIRTCPPDFIDTKRATFSRRHSRSIGLSWLAAQEAFAGEAEDIVSPHDSARAKQINAISPELRGTHLGWY
ncbi:MAG: hypothetical protein GY903_32370 [Fuerstiella sp.]|nr:hypothetical protein [Fuerstiella sp.]MCP4859188.1 hypothetical protein [Fuerstiella sp.]